MHIAKLSYDTNPSVEVERETLGARGNIDIVTFKGDTRRLVQDLAPYDGILTDYVPLTGEIIAGLDKCKVISVEATGWTSVDGAAAAAKGIYVCALGEYCTQEVADHTLALLLALQRRLVLFNNNAHLHKKWDWQVAPDIERMEGQTLGLLGFGRIGQAVAARAKAFGLRVIAYDPFLPPDVAAAINAPLKNLDEVLAESDYISVHMAVDDDNKGLLDYARFRQMPRRPFIINVARGLAINEPDLVRALDEGLLRGAGLDVLSTERPDLAAHPLTGRDNVILTPHAAFYSRTSLYLIYKIATENIMHVLAGDFARVNKLVAVPGL